MVELDEKHLIDRCRRNDLDAFNQLVLRYQDRIFNTVYRIINDHATTLDVCQESFMRAFQSIKKFRGQSNFLTWLHQIAVNLCYNYKRARRPITGLPNDDLLNQPPSGNPTSNPGAVLEENEQSQIIQQALDSLEQDLRSVVVLKDVEGYSYKEISTVLHCSVGAVRGKLTKARESLKQQLHKLIG